jgi:hypothetical protein
VANTDVDDTTSVLLIEMEISVFNEGVPEHLTGGGCPDLATIIVCATYTYGVRKWKS